MMTGKDLCQGHGLTLLLYRRKVCGLSAGGLARLEEAWNRCVRTTGKGKARPGLKVFLVIPGTARAAGLLTP